MSDKKKFELYSKCQAYINPQKEDFGITIIEAMASGRPVIALRKGGALETIMEGKTGIFFDNETAGDVARAVENFQNKDFNPRIIREHAKQFSHENFKKQIKEFIKEKYKEFRE